MVERKPKTANAIRSMKVPDIVLDALKEREEKHLKDRLVPGFKDNNYVSYIIETGESRVYTGATNFLRKLSKENNIWRITYHGLRHVFATILLEEGVTLPKISLILGHASVNTTFEHYVSMINENNEITAYFNDKFAFSESDSNE